MSERLPECNAVEWLEIAKKFVPGLTEAQFNEMWDEFQAEKAQRPIS